MQLYFVNIIQLIIEINAQIDIYERYNLKVNCQDDILKIYYYNKAYEFLIEYMKNKPFKNISTYIKLILEDNKSKLKSYYLYKDDLTFILQ